MSSNVKKSDAVSIQFEISSQEDWNEAMKLTGLLVIDAYQGWCGPCTAMQSTLKKLKIDLGDDLLHFAIARVDGQLPVLDPYRGDCTPTWLFYASGQFLGVLKGTNAPLMTTTLKELLEAERKFLNEEGTRITVESITSRLHHEKSLADSSSEDDDDGKSKTSQDQEK